MTKITAFAIPAVLLITSLFMLFSKKDLLAVFLKGAENGLKSGVKLIPTLVLLMSGIKMFTASGALKMLVEFTGGFFEFLKIPSEILPFILVRPISGSAAMAMLKEIFTIYGADSFAGRCASIISGSGDTIIYTFAVYFSYIGIKKTRHTLPCAFLTQLFSIFVACIIASFL